MSRRRDGFVKLLIQTTSCSILLYTRKRAVLLNVSPRFPWTAKSRSFQSILGLMRADECMIVLAGKYQGTEKGGRSLLAKVCKLQEDLEVVSLTMDRRVGGRVYIACTSAKSQVS